MKALQNKIQNLERIQNITNHRSDMEMTEKIKQRWRIVTLFLTKNEWFFQQNPFEIATPNHKHILYS